MRRLRKILLTATALMPIAPALAGPNGGVVVGGSAQINNQGTANVTINQFSDKAIINWNLFNIGVGEKTTFVQPNSNAIALNRIVGGQGPSQILGSLDANGKVFVVNPDGIIFGAGAVITTAGFLATTSDIRNQDFMAGRFNFNMPGRPDASIVNMGTITATSGGFAALVAPGVRNSGTITATLGTVTLASGNTFNLDFYGDRLVQLGVGDQIAGQVKDVATGQTLKSLVTNEGKLKANGGRVELTAAAARQVVDSVINTSGVVEANSIGTKNGQIVLSAATGHSSSGSGQRGRTAVASALPPQKVKVSGTLSAAGKKAGTKGGTITITGEHIEVAGATINASGREGGGKVMIGGDWGGGKPDTSLVTNQSATIEANAIPTATTVTVDAATKIDASAKDKGDGGKVVLWSDQTTTFAGTILALGGAQFGNGGFVETSGHSLSMTGKANAGHGGTWLLDPDDLNIDSSLAPTIAATLGGGSNVTASTSSGGSGGVGDITVSSQVAWSSAATLTLNAYKNINLPEIIGAGPSQPNLKNTGAGNVVLHANNEGAFAVGSGQGIINMPLSTFNNRLDWSLSSGKVTVFYNPTGYTTPTNFTSPPAAGHFTLASPSQLTAYMLVNSDRELQDVNSNLGGTYALGKDIANFANIPNFNPLGTVGGPFTGKFEGDGHTITGLHIAPTLATTNNIGLFAAIGGTGVVQNLTLANATIAATTGGAPSQFVGVLAGQNSGHIDNVHVINATPAVSTVDAGIFSGVITGGLVGQNQSGGQITNSSSAAHVMAGNGTTGPSGGNTGGGLVGFNQGQVTGSNASGTVEGGVNAFIGGLAGRNDLGTISNSSASGNVTTTAANAFGTATGGLVGFNNGTINSSSTSTGTVTTHAGGSAGGLVGQNEATIANSSASGNVSGTGASSLNTLLGGLVANNHSSAITNSSATGTVSTGGFASVGGLIGSNNADLSNLSAANPITTSGNSVTAGGLIGNNSGNLTNVFASNNVSASGNQATIGGLVGFNTAGTITNSHATGNVTSTFNATGQFDQTAAGGLVGTNNGTIAGTSQPNVNTACAAGASCATGNVSVGSHGNGGGLVGFNTGIITNSFATGGVIGGPGLSEDAGTNLGGLVGLSSGGTISGSHARGAVGGNVAFLMAGGLVGDNSSAINNSFASGNVTGGNTSQVGGLVGGTGGECPGCTGNISNATASGNVTVGATGIAGGLAGAVGQGSVVSNTSATGAVTGGHDSVIGGLAGALDTGAITGSQASGAVSSTGANVMAGGLVGVSFGTISNSTASNTVTVATDSFAGGLVGGTIGLVNNNSSASGAVNGGSNSVVGGLAGANAGTITQSSASGAVTTGDFGVAGGLVGGNIVYEGVPPGFTLPGSSFPSGTIVSSSSTGAVTGGASSTVGGLLGINGGTISGLSSSATVSGGNGSIVGGLVGQNGGPSGGPTLPAAVTGCQNCPLGSLSVSSNGGTIANSSASGQVSGGTLSIVGGLVGSNPGTISGSQSTAALNVPNALLLGGLVGLNDTGGSIVNSSASGVVTGSTFAVGGLVGVNIGSIAGSHATGAVTGDDGSLVGGLVGFNLLGSIQNSFSVSNVSTGAGGAAGGLVAINFGSIGTSFATGKVTGGDGSYVGGLVAYNFGTPSIPGQPGPQNAPTPPIGVISQSYATGPVTGGANSVVGGLVAENAGSIDQGYAAGRVTGGAGSITGGLVASNNFTVPGGNPLFPQVTGTTGTATNSYWDTQTTGQSTSAGGTGQTSGQLTNTLPPGFSPTVWTTGTGRYPFFVGQSDPLPTPGDPVTNPPVVNPPVINPPVTNPQQPQLPQVVDNLLSSTIVSQSPQANIVQQLTNNITTDTNKSELVINNQSGGSSGQGGQGAGGNSPGGQKGNQGGNAGRPPANVVAAFGLGPLPSGMPPLNETRFLNDRVAFQLGTTLSDRELGTLLNQLGLEVLYQEDVGLLGRKVLSLKLPAGATVRAIIARLEAKGAYFMAQPIYQHELMQDLAQAPSPADTNRKGDSAQYIVEKLGLPEAHLIATGKDVKVAVIDSEIDQKHPDLEGAVTANYDALPSDDQTAHPHGTGMAGAIASHKRLLGIAPNARILAVRAFGVNTGGAQGTSMNIVKGLQWAVDQGAKIINMSFAGPKDPILQQAMQRLTDQGIILIAAAGNAGPKSPPLFPGADPNVIAVSATDVDNKTYKNANRGKYVAIASPGVDILVPAPDGGYQLTTGTSVAAAHISGVVALMLERNKELKPAEVRAILTATAKNIGGVKTDVGAGLVDPAAALAKSGPKSAQLQ
ncbi:MAG: GLUG motif-containing protein [Alphaproteobacteria bacterium]